MPVTVIAGGQFGSEGKGKVAHFFTKKYEASVVVRVGGPNSGHTVYDSSGNALIFKHLSTGSIIRGVKSVLTAGHYIDLEILRSEIALSKIDKSDLLIDPFAVIITQQHKDAEKREDLINSIGSTGCGIGAAISERVARKNKLVYAIDIPELKEYIQETNTFLRGCLNRNERVIIEGTQGFGLSLLHSNIHPFSTSRDTTAAAFVSEAGLSPMDVDDVILVIRAFPIRVAGNSGPIDCETTWGKISEDAGSENEFHELTSVSKKIRRVAEFNSNIVLRAISYNAPTKIVLNHVDYFDKRSVAGGVSEIMTSNVKQITSSINRKIDYIGINQFDLIELK